MIDSDNIDAKYICVICQEVLNYPPVSLQKCGHSFCRNCITELTRDINTNKKKMNLKCPSCRNQFNVEDLVINEDLYKEMKSRDVICKCGNIIKLNQFNDHFYKCSLQKKNLNSAIKKNLVKDAKPSVNRDTFNCTICTKKNFDREGMLKHIINEHGNAYGVCPICIVQTWGDPNYKTYLIGHMKKRHNFGYEETVDYNQDEDEVLRQVLEKSKHDK